MTARTGRDPGELYWGLVKDLGETFYERIETPVTRDQKAALDRVVAREFNMTQLAGDPVVAVIDTAPGNQAPIGGIKVITENGWFAARPSGTEDVRKVYAESFISLAHLRDIQDEAISAVARVS